MKQKIIAALLALFLGEFGIHWFYLNDQAKGKKYLTWSIIGIVLTPVVIGIVPLLVMYIIGFVDCFKILFLTDEEFDELYNQDECFETEDEILED